MSHMKRYVLTLIPFAIFAALVSCQGEGDSRQTLVPAQINAVAASSADAPKTELSGKSVLWCEGDAVSVFPDAGAMQRFVTNAGGASSSFAGKLPYYTTKVDVLYPYDASAAFSEGKFTTTLPSVQTGVAGGFSGNLAIMTASGNVDGFKATLTFKQACSLVKIKVSASDVAGVDLVAPDGTTVCGKVTIDAEQGAPEAVQAGSTVSLVPPEGAASFAPGDYYFTVLPFQAQDCRVIYHIGKQTKTRTLAISAARASIFNVEGSDADLDPDPYKKTVKVDGTALAEISDDIFEGIESQILFRRDSG